MSKITILSTAKSMLVFKALGMAPLRIFPGYNYVEEKDLNKYFDKNPAALAKRKEFLKASDFDLTRKEAEQAAAAEAKNKELNKANRIIKSNAKTMDDDKKTIGDQEKAIKALEEQAAADKETMAVLMGRLDALESPADPPADPAKKGK